MKKKILRIMLFLLPLALAAIVPLASAGNSIGGVLGAYLNLINDRSTVVVDHADLEKNMVKGMLEATDRYSYFQEMSVYNSQQDEYQDAKFVGIGVSMTEDANGAHINSVFTNSPAYNAGFKAGDVIVSVNGKSVAGWSLADIAAIVKGPEGTDVLIGILKDGVGEEKIYTLTRASIELKTVSHTFYKEAAYIRITGFTDKTGAEFADALEKINNSGTKDIIVDLRDNGGGTVRGCVNTVRHLMDGGTVVKMDFQYGGYIDIRYVAAEKDIDYNVVIIVNENSASASEIMAAAVQENGFGVLVGERTYGKSLVQSSYTVFNEEAYEKYSKMTGETNMYLLKRETAKLGISVEDDELLGAVKLTIGEYLTPNGNTINNSGIKPDYTVEFDGDPAYDELPEGEIFIYDKYSVGMASEQVSKAKFILRELGYYNGAVNGSYDEEIMKSVTEFQDDEGLYPYGVLDFTTQGALNNRLKLFDADEDDQLIAAYEILMEGGDNE